jgi:hypothetical protein
MPFLGVEGVDGRSMGRLSFSSDAGGSRLRSMRLSGGICGQLLTSRSRSSSRLDDELVLDGGYGVLLMVASLVLDC